MIHNAFCSILTAGLLLALAPNAEAVTFEIVDNGTDYDAIVTTEAGDAPIFAVDFFIAATDGAVVSALNNNGNPFDRPFSNDTPPGEPISILIGGSDINGVCDNSTATCFGDFACGGGTCVFGQTGSIKVGEISWNGVGTLALETSSDAVDGPELNVIPKTNLSGCQRINGDEVLAGDDTNANGIVRACECGDPNETGAFEADDLFAIFNCQTGGGGLPAPDPTAQNEPCKTRIHQGDGQNSGAFEADDLFTTFLSQGDPVGPRVYGPEGSTCAARPGQLLVAP